MPQRRAIGAHGGIDPCDEQVVVARTRRQRPIDRRHAIVARAQCANFEVLEGEAIERRRVGALELGAAPLLLFVAPLARALTFETHGLEIRGADRRRAARADGASTHGGHITDRNAAALRRRLFGA